MLNLLASKRFLPLFLVQFLGAFNDNLFKNAFIVLVTYKTAAEMGWNTSGAVNAIMILFIAPMIFCSSVAGQMADRFEKSTMVRWTKVGEIFVMALAVWGFLAGLPYLLFATVFLTGVQIAFFSPLKYGILPVHLAKKELVGGSAILEASTFVAILAGTGMGALAIEGEAAGMAVAFWVPWVLMVLAFAGLAASFWIPAATPSGHSFPISWNILRSSLEILRDAKPQVGVWRSMLGISWFWAIGSIWLAFIPPFVSEDLHADKSVAALFLTLFSLGIGAGALLCQRLLHGEISAKYVPLAGLGFSAFTVCFVALHSVRQNEVFSPLSPAGFLMCACLVGVAVCGGIFSVPLYAILQAWSEPSHCSRNIAASNILGALFMVAANGSGMVLSLAGMDGAKILLLAAFLNAAIAFYTIRVIPEAVLHTFVRWLMRALFRVRVVGLENYYAAGERKVIIANHVSFLDAVLLTAFLPEIPTFAIDTKISRAWWIRPFLWMAKVHPLDPTNPMAIKSLTKLVKEKVPVVIFPEGRLTVTGGVMKVYQGPGLMVLRGDADLLPIQLDGVQFSFFSYLGKKTKQHLFPEITMTVLPPVRLEPSAEGGRAARTAVVTRIYDILTEMAVSTAPTRSTLFESLRHTKKLHGPGFPAVNDPTLSPLSYRKLISRSLALAPRLCKGTNPGDAIGVLLPNSKGTVLALFGIQAAYRVAAMLNFSSGPKNLVSTCRTAQVRVVWTSERFIREAGLEKSVAALREAGIEIRFLESLRARPSLPEIARFFAASLCPSLLWKMTQKSARKKLHLTEKTEADSPAVILFTSGSSGAPKAVVLSHRNLLTNVFQLRSRIDMTRQDRVFNCLPMFHSFGLTGGTLTPLLGGIPIFLYPSPLHYGIIPELVYQTDSTILFGTNTFLNGYSKKAHPYDFHSVRYVFAGAEKVKESTKKVWADVFGVRIFEGYGSTECSPAISINTPMFNEPSSVGRFLPGIEYKVESIPGISEGGKLWVRGANIMLGYYLPEAPGKLVPPPEGWYDTGDIVEVSSGGFIKILGRMKRFAKVAGEMVSLTAVEELAAAAWPGTMSAAFSIPNERKGEEIWLVTEMPAPKREALLAQATKAGLTELVVPKVIVEGKIPVLGSGKPDYISLQATFAPKNDNPTNP